jgi:class 3 adenylate cyclase
LEFRAVGRCESRRRISPLAFGTTGRFTSIRDVAQTSQVRKSGHARRSAERSCRSQILPSNIGSGRSFGLGRSQPMYNQRVPAGFCVNLRDAGGRAISETRKIAAILVADVVGYSRLVGAEEDRILARLRALRSDLIDPTISVHYGRVDKRTGDGSSSSSAAWSTRCAAQLKGRTTSSIATSSRPTRRPASRRHQRQVVQDGQIPRGNCA